VRFVLFDQKTYNIFTEELEKLDWIKKCE
jgi:hypothetical protein